MILPTIHSNGTSAEDLLNGYRNAAQAVKFAEDALRAIEFNARDYIEDDTAWRDACADMQERLWKLQQVYGELLTIAEHCQQYIQDKAERMLERSQIK